MQVLLPLRGEDGEAGELRESNEDGDGFMIPNSKRKEIESYEAAIYMNVS